MLAASQLWGGLGIASGLAVGALLALEITGRPGLSGLPQTANVLGSALLAVPLARLAGRAGRRVALLTGFGVAAAGAAVALASAVVGSFPLLLLGTAMAGGGSAAGFQARFAATDGVAPASHGRVLSIVVWMTTVGAVLGPNLLGPGAQVEEALGLAAYAGSWLFAAVGLACACLVVAVGLRKDRPAVVPARGAPVMRTLRELVRRPEGAVGIATIATAHPVMVGIMAMSAVHLSGHGSTIRVIGLVISVHVLGMFGFSPVFGWLVDRVGAVWVVAAGVAILAAGAGLAAYGGVLNTGHDHAAAESFVGLGLFLIGLGWSACLISGSTLIARASLLPGGELSRTDVQGASDLVMGLAGASAGAASGLVLAAIGYSGLAIAGGALVLPLLALVAIRRKDIARYPHPHQPAGGRDELAEKPYPPPVA